MWLILQLLTIQLALCAQSSVLELNDKFMDVKGEGMWFVEFYAPWCAHCKRLQPIWEHVAHAVQDRGAMVRVGKMDCTRFTAAASQLNIQGYPTIAFFRNGQRIDYHGERTKEALVNFAIKTSGPVIETVNAVRLNEIRNDARHDPVFLIVDGEKDEMYTEFERVANTLFSKVRFITAPPASVPASLRESSNRIAVLKDDDLIPFTSTPDEFESWVLSERWPVFPRAHSSNLVDLGSNGKLLVIVVANELENRNDSSAVGSFYRRASEAAAMLRKHEGLQKMYQFVWLDGGDIVSSITMSHVEPPAIVIFNYTSYEFYLSDDEPERMTKSSIITWLENLSESIEKGTAQPLGGRAMLTRVRRMVFEVYTQVYHMFYTQPLLSSCLFGVPIAFFSIICYSICSADFSVERDEFYPEDEDEEEDDEGEMDESLEAKDQERLQLRNPEVKKKQ